MKSKYIFEKKVFFISVLFLLFLGCSFFLSNILKGLAERSIEAELNLIACRTISLRIVEFLENKPQKWPPSWEDLRISQINVSGGIPFNEMKKRVHLNLNVKLNEVFSKFSLGIVNSKNFPKFVSTCSPRFKNVEYECNFWILQALRKANGKATDEENNLEVIKNKNY